MFRDVCEQAGLSFVYDNGATGKVLMVESIGGGCGWLDFDCDGAPDLYLCQGGNPAPTDATPQPRDQLFRNLGNGHFAPVTEGAGIAETRYSQGVAVGDFDNDGFDDVYITNVGRNTLLQNQGDGTFLDVTQPAEVGDERWSSSAAWGDLDRDGDLDLYVCNYLNYDPFHPLPCSRPDGTPATCHPRDVDAVPDECYLNLGDGRFRPVAAERGLVGEGNKALGVVIADLNQDGWPDIYVANDTRPNFLFINQGNAVFQESATLLGCAVSHAGLSQASMGVGCADYDRNGFLDLYCTHFTFESNTLYRNLGPSGFQDVTGLVGLHTPTLMRLAFGTVMADFDQNGLMDIFVTNGHIDDWRYKGEDRDMPPQLFSFDGRRFHEADATAGDFFRREALGRGVASADYDADGDIDLVVVHQNSPTALLRNDSERGHSLKFRFRGRASNRRGLGVRLVVDSAGEKWTQELAGGTSFAASHEPVLIFGLGERPQPCSVEVTWPSGRQQRLEQLAIDREYLLVEPDGEADTGTARR